MDQIKLNSIACNTILTQSLPLKIVSIKVSKTKRESILEGELDKSNRQRVEVINESSSCSFRSVIGFSCYGENYFRAT